MNVLHEQLQSAIYSFGYNLLIQFGLNSQAAHYINTIALLLVFFVLLYFTAFVLRRILMLVLIKTIRRSKTRFDDFLIHNKVLKYLTYLIPLIIAKQSLPLIFTGFPQITHITVKMVDISLIIAFTLLLKSIFYTFKDVLHSRKRFTDKPLDSYFQVISIVLYIVCAILIFSELTGKEPYGLLTALGAASAIVILVFKIGRAHV